MPLDGLASSPSAIRPATLIQRPGRRRRNGRTSRRSDKVGVIEIRTLYIESDEEIVDRTHRALEHIKRAEVYLSTDCGLKAVPRFCAYEKLRALSVCRGA